MDDDAAAQIQDATGKYTGADEKGKNATNEKEKADAENQKAAANETVRNVVTSRPTPKNYTLGSQYGRNTGQLDLAENWSNGAVQAAERGGNASELSPALDERSRVRNLTRDYKGAEADATRSLKIDPDNAAALHERAKARYHLGQGDLAWQDIRRAKELAPNDQEIGKFVKLIEQRGPGKVKLDKPGFESGGESGTIAGAAGQNKSQEALKPYAPEAAIPARPPFAVTPNEDLLREGERRIANNDPKGALLPLTQAISADARNPRARDLRAQALNALKEYEAAQKDAEESLKLDPKNAEAFRNLANSYLGQGNFQEALEAAEKAVELDPQSGLGYYYRAQAHEKLGNRAKAIADYQSAIDHDAGLAPLIRDSLARLRPGQPPLAPEATPLMKTSTARWGMRAIYIPMAAALILFGLVDLLRGEKGFIGRLTTRSKPTPAAEEGERGSPATVTLPSGAVLGGNYQILRELGRGGMGIVYEAEDQALQRRVAIKQMRRHDEASDEDWEKFLAEARLAAKLEHPRLVRILSVITEDDLYLVFERVEGRTLDTLLAANGRKLPLPQARQVLADVCAGIDYAHAQKIIHRDLKPANIMVASDGSSKIMDFGIAHQASHDLTQTAACGTPPYMAPEQATGSVSKASDIYALGVMAYEMVTGQRPFDGPDFLDQKLRQTFTAPTERDAALPKSVNEFFRTALQADPAKRFASAADFIAAFEAAARNGHAAS